MSTIKVLRSLDTKTNAEVYIVGGYVRDFLRRKDNKDLDVVVRGLDLTEIETFLSPFGKTKQLTIHRVKGTVPVTFVSFIGNGDTIEAQISVVKDKEGGNIRATLRQDGSHRDFSINAMYMPINSMSSKSIIDLFGGKNDISAKQILTIGSAKKTFIDSPIRIMRAFSLSARLNYTIANHTRVGISASAHLLKHVSGDAIRMELEEILLSPKPSKQLKLMEELGVLKIILPELQACVGCTQDKKYHKYDVFNHLLNACDSVEPDLILRLSALLHDIGKPSARKIIDDRITFHKHEVFGSKEVGIILKRLHFDNETIMEVAHLIRMHMYHYTREFSDVGVRRFIQNAGIKEKDLDDIENFKLFKLRQADRLGNGNRKEQITDRQRDFEKRIVEVFKSSTGFTIKDLDINGNILMEVFNILPGKQIGRILQYLLDVIIDDPGKNNERSLMEEALNFILLEKEHNKVIYGI